MLMHIMSYLHSWLEAATGCTSTGGPASPTFTPNGNNEITNGGYAYDAAGNVTTDNNGYIYAWNAEGLRKSESNGPVTYTYDGDDKRVEKSSGTYYWFSPGGLPLAETDTSGNTQNECIYFNGAHTARWDSSGGTEGLSPHRRAPAPRRYL